MIKHYFKLYLLLFCLILSACASNLVTRHTVVQDAENMTGQGLQAYSEADWNRAYRLFSKALSLYEGIDHQQGVLYSHINLAQVALSVGDYPEIKAHLAVATDIVITTEFQHYQPHITLLFAQSAIQQQRYAYAEKKLRLLLPEFNELTPVSSPDMVQLTAIASQTKIAFAQQQNESLWTQRYAEALRLSTRHSAALENRLLRFQANLLQRQQYYQRAESHLQHALFSYKTTHSRAGIAMTLAELGHLSMAQGHWQEAQNYFMRSNKVFRYIGDLEHVMHNTQQLKKIESQIAIIDRISTMAK